MIEENDIFGIPLFIPILILIFLRIPVTNKIYGKPEAKTTKEHIMQGNDPIYPGQSQEQPICPNCGISGMKGANFCEECGSRMDAPSQPESFN